MLLENPFVARISNFQRDCGRLGRPHTTWGRRSSRPRLELLEERTLLSIDMVENSNDSGTGSLRQTIINAAAGDTIEFDMTTGHVTSPITLTSGKLDITQDLDIEAPALPCSRSAETTPPRFSTYSPVRPRPFPG